MIQQYPKFKKLQLNDRDTLEQAFARYPSDFCERSLCNLYAWQAFDHPRLTLINDNICILITPPNEEPYFYEPLGKRNLAATLRGCLEHTGKLSRISRDAVACFDPDSIDVRQLRDQFDYLYRVKTISQLRGRKYDGKRNHIRKFAHAHPDHDFVSFESSHVDEALELFDTWAAVRRGSKGEVANLPQLAYDCQRDALKSLFAHYDKLNTMGGAMMIKDRLAGFVIGTHLHDSTASVPFMYAHPGIRNITPAMLREACRTIFAGYEYLNLEQDLGLKGLRRMKLSYYPAHIVEKFEITAKY